MANKRQNFIKKILIPLVLAGLLFTSLILSACPSFGRIAPTGLEFNNDAVFVDTVFTQDGYRQEIRIRQGQQFSINVEDFVFIPYTANLRGVMLSEDYGQNQTNFLTITGNTVIASTMGTTTLVATSTSNDNAVATIVVVVDYPRAFQVPQNIEFDYSNYPALMLTWDALDLAFEATIIYNIRITATDGRIVTTGFPVSTSSINLSDFIGYSNILNIFNTDFLISVQAVYLEREIFYTVGEFSAPITISQLPQTARNYLQSRFLNGHRNHFVASENELAELLTLARLFRQNQIGGANNTVELQVFIGFEFDGTTQSLLEQALQMHHLAGTVDFDFSIYNRQHLSLTLTFLTDGTPSRAATPRQVYERFDSHIPAVHFGTPRSNAIGMLPIERSSRAVPVSTSDQLFFVAELGYRPVPIQGSVAERIYNAARTSLRYIIDYDFNEFQQIHAIYSYLLWRVRFCQSAMEQATPVANAVQLNAFYLEGVFDDRRAVCDGISKAFSLMANMQGLNAMRIAGVSIATNIGHAWNRVQLDGRWYNVDITWGNKALNLSPALTFPRTDTRDVGTHAFFLKTDYELRYTHRVATPNNYPPSTDIPFNIYEFLRFEKECGTVVNRYLNSVEYRYEQADNLAQHLLDILPSPNYQNYLLEYFVGQPGFHHARGVTRFVSFDIKVNKDVSDYYNFLMGMSPLHYAFIGQGLTYGQDFFITSLTTISGEMLKIVFICINAVSP